MNTQFTKYKFSYRMIGFLQSDNNKPISETLYDKEKARQKIEEEYLEKLEKNLELLKEIVPLLEEANLVKYDRDKLNLINE